MAKADLEAARRSLRENGTLGDVTGVIFDGVDVRELTSDELKSFEQHARLTEEGATPPDDLLPPVSTIAAQRNTTDVPRTSKPKTGS